MSSKILQYVILRKDLVGKKSSFSLGANMAQACHAAGAAIFKTFTSPHTTEFLSSLEDMTVCVLSIESAAELEAIGIVLKQNDIPFHLWIEKPENIPTALATAPMPKDIVFPYVSHLKLLR